MVKWILIVVFALIAVLDVLLVFGSAKLERNHRLWEEQQNLKETRKDGSKW